MRLAASRARGTGRGGRSSSSVGSASPRPRRAARRGRPRGRRARLGAASGGERGALEAGALGRRCWEAAVADAPLAPRSPGSGRSTTSRPLRARRTAGIIAAAAAGDIEALLVGGVDPSDLGDGCRRGAREGVRRLPRAARVARHGVADVVLLSRWRPRRWHYVSGGAASAPARRRWRGTPSATHRALDWSAGEMGVFPQTPARSARSRPVRALGAWGWGTPPRAPPGEGRARRRAPRHRRLRPVRPGPRCSMLVHAGRRAVLAGTAPLAVAARLSWPRPPGRRRRWCGRHRDRPPWAASRCRRSSPRTWSRVSSGSRPTRRTARSRPLGTDAGGRVHVTKGGAAWPRPDRMGRRPTMTENPTADFSDTPWWLARSSASSSTVRCAQFERRAMAACRSAGRQPTSFGLLQTLDGMKSMLKKITPAAPRSDYTSRPAHRRDDGVRLLRDHPAGGTVSMFADRHALEGDRCPRRSRSCSCSRRLGSASTALSRWGGSSGSNLPAARWPALDFAQVISLRDRHGPSLVAIFPLQRLDVDLGHRSRTALVGYILPRFQLRCLRHHHGRRRPTVVLDLAEG